MHITTDKIKKSDQAIKKAEAERAMDAIVDTYKDIEPLLMKDKNPPEWELLTQHTVWTLNNLQEDRVLFVATLIATMERIKRDYPKELENAEKVHQVASNIKI